MSFHLIFTPPPVHRSGQSSAHPCSSDQLSYRHNLRRHYLLNSNYADISFLFTIQPGETGNDHLDREYLAVLETDNATPYYLNLHNREVAHTLILGATGSGNAFLRKYVRNLGTEGQWNCRLCIAYTQSYLING